MLKAILAGAAVLVVALAALVYINRSGKQSQTSSSELTITDDEGRKIGLSDPPLRIVSLAPHFTELLIEVGRGGRLVGVSGGETYPPQATALPPLVASDGITPDVEAIKAAKPDLVLAAGAPSDPWKDALVQGSIRLAAFRATSVTDALSDMEKVGRLVGAPEKTAGLLRELRRSLSEVAAEEKSKPKVFVETFPSPLEGAGPEGFTGDLVRRAGGEPVGPAGEYGPIPLEAVAAANPDFYIAVMTSASTADEIRGRSGFGTLRAVKEGRVFVIDDDLVLRPGPRLAEGVRRIAALIHPK